MSWTLADIETKVREITGTPSTDQMSQSSLQSRINQFYEYSMPHEIKNQVLNNYLDFQTSPNQATYAVPSGYITNEPKAYADGMDMTYYENPNLFYQDFPQQYVQDSVDTGDGATANYTDTVVYPPIIAGSFLITGNSASDGSTMIVTDDGSGNLIGDINGAGNNTINYVTGAFDVTFVANVTNGDAIYDKYQSYTAARPYAVLFYENQFTLRPIPDAVYAIRLEGFIKPGALATGDTATFEEWGPYIAYGTALDIFLSRGDMLRYNEYFPVFKRFENIALGRTIQQYSQSRAIPTF